MNALQQMCSPDLLEDFLQGTLSGRRVQELTSHLDDCSSCRRDLEAKAAEPAYWREAGEMFTGGFGNLTISAEANSRGLDSSPLSQQTRSVLATLAPTDDPLMLGRLGAYEVMGVVGEGGMGVVLKAHDRSLDRTVAIKVMAPHLASSGSARARFAREAKAAAAVLHPNVIAIHGVSNDQALPYLVMPYVRGASLQKRIDSEGALPLSEALRIGAQIAAGLAAAHAQGLVHRDIKPANVLLEEGIERVAITDFGLARAVDDASMTRSGVIAGTPQYMSPEQARGESIDQRSDLFSLGSVLYAICSGRPPFRAETTYGTIRRITEEEAKSVREINPDIPDWLSAIIGKLMAKRPADRFASAGEVSELLEKCLAHVQQPTTVPLPVNCPASEECRQADRPPGTRPRFPRIPPARSGRLIMGAVFACAIAFAGIAIVLELNKGTLIIESAEAGVPIRIKQGNDVAEELTVTAGSNSVRVAAGQYVVEIVGPHDGLQVGSDGVVTVTRGDRKLVTITRRNGDETSLQGDWKTIDVSWTGMPADPRLVRAARCLIEKNVLTLTGNGAVRVDDAVYTFKLNEATRPRQIDLEEINGDETHLGIYELEGDQLRLYFRQRQRPKGFEAAVEGSPPTAMIVLQRLNPDQGPLGDPNAVIQRLSPQAVTQSGDSIGRWEAQPGPESLVQVFFQHPHKAKATLMRGKDQWIVFPGRVSFPTGQLIRFKLSEVPNYQGVELSGSFELAPISKLTRTYLEHNAIPIQITSDDMDQAIAGNMVTKVIYLPNAEHAEVAIAGVESLVTSRLDPGVNPFITAQRRGTIIAVWRLGNRLEPPTVKDNTPANAGPLEIGPNNPPEPKESRSRTNRWEIRIRNGQRDFDPSDPTKFCQILDLFRIEIGFADAESQEMIYLSNTSTASPTVRRAPAINEKRLFLIKADNSSILMARSIFSRAKLECPRLVIWFLPRKTEQHLAALEANAATGRSIDDVEKTVFGVRPLGGGWEFYVVSQTLRPPAAQGHVEPAGRGQLVIGQWEFVSYEEDGVVKEYKPGTFTLSVGDGLWRVAPTIGDSGSHRFELDGTRLTFHGTTSTGGASGYGGDHPSIAYGILTVTGDSLVYCMTPFSAEVSDVFGPGGASGVSPPSTFETKGNQNIVYRLRRIMNDGK